MDLNEEMLHDLTHKWRREIWRPFMAAVRDYRLVEPGDRIAVCVSGGKDSMLLAKCMQALKRHAPYPLYLRFLVMDPGYEIENRRRIEENGRRLGIPLEFFDADIFSAMEQMGSASCHMCAMMRRGTLWREAQRRGCGKIALGHHFDDAIETLLMSMLYGGQIRGMLPMRGSDNVPGMRLIRPLYRVREEHILAWRDENGLEFLQCACRAAREAGLREDGSSDSKRLEIKELIRRLRALNPNADRNLFASMHNVSLDTMIRWKYRGNESGFLDEFASGGVPKETP